MAKAPASFDFFYTNWLEGTDVLSDRAYRAYMRLLIYQWVNGYLPSDTAMKQLLGRLDDGDFKRIWDEIASKFVLIEAGDVVDYEGSNPSELVRVNPKMHELRQSRIPVYAERSRVSAKRSEAGRKGAARRWQNDGKCHGKTMANEWQNDGNYVRRKMSDVSNSSSEEYQEKESTSGFDAETPPPPPVVHEPDPQPSVDLRAATEQVIATWNATPGVCHVDGLVLNGTRLQQLRHCLGHPGWLERFKTACETKFPLRCGSERGWKPGLNWILDIENLDRVLEGQYDWNAQEGRSRRPGEALVCPVDF